MYNPTLLECGHAPTPRPPGSISTGYGIAPDGARHCFACCADRDRADMIETGRAVLYLVSKHDEPLEVTNWPGSLRFPVMGSNTSKHGGGFGSQRTDAWFTGPDGKLWHAVNRGDNQLARCRRLKS